MAFGVDSVTGFNLKRFRDIQLALQGLLDQVIDPDTGETLVTDFGEDDPLINILNTFIDEMSGAWETLELSYNQFDPNLSAGPSLSGLVQLNGLARKGGTPSVISIQFFGTIGAIIPAGQQITDINQITVWVTDAQVTLDGSGEATGTASSQQNGAFTADISSVNLILTPVVGWDAINNTSESTLGKLDESDSQLKIRRDNGTLTPAQSIVECIQSNILNLDDVTYSRVFQNRTLIVDGNGIPGKELAAVVLGATDAEVAQEIYVRLGTGTDTFGTTTVPITDPFGQITNINFIRPTQVLIDIEIDLTITDSNLFGASSPDDIKDAIVVYAAQGAAGLGINQGEAGFDPFGFPPGEPVLISRLFTPVNSVPGHNVTRLEISKNPAAVADTDVPILFDEVAQFLVANITIVVS